MLFAQSCRERLIVIGVVLSVILTSACAPTNRTLASKAIQDKRYEEAVSYLNQGANEGDPHCNYLLGTLLLTGREGLDADRAEASVQFRKAALAGIPEAQFELARLYENGAVAEKNGETAAEWYHKAAGAGLREAQSRLGLLYAVGQGVAKDLTVAAEWYRKAAMYGDPVGQAALGAATFWGRGVPQNNIEGYMWTKLAVDQGNTMAKKNFKEIYPALTEDERAKAQNKVSKFRPKGSRKNNFSFSHPIFGPSSTDPQSRNPQRSKATPAVSLNQIGQI